MRTRRTSAPGTAEGQNSAIDSLFHIPDDDNNAGGDIDFGSMDFLNDDSGNTQNNDTSHTQNTDFDLSTFGNTSQDFNMTDLNTATNTNETKKLESTNETGNVSAAETGGIAAVDDVFGDLSGGGDSMDLDIDLGMVGAEDSVFDDMFFGGGDESMGGDGGMEHGEFDNVFFGLD
jgi:hypothetical protein